MTQEGKLKANIYLDQNNIAMSFQRLNFSNLLKFLKQQYEIEKATTYCAYDYSLEPKKKFIVYMANNGWKCNTVDINVNTNIGTILTADMINDSHVFLSHKVIVLISGDSEYSYPLSLLSEKGYKIHVIGAKNDTSLELLKAADTITYLEDIEGLDLIVKTSSHT